MLATGGQPATCVVDTCNVYWTDFQTGGLMMVSKNGGTVETIATSAIPVGALSVESSGLAIDSNNLYWSEFDNGGGGDVVQTSLAAGLPRRRSGLEASLAQ